MNERIPHPIPNPDSVPEANPHLNAANEDTFDGVIEVEELEAEDTPSRVTVGSQSYPGNWELEPTDETTTPTPDTASVGDPNRPKTWELEPAAEQTEEREVPTTEQPANTPETEVTPTQEHTLLASEAAVYNKFKDTFNIDAETLTQIEGFAELSRDQKAFVLNNLEQASLTKVQTESITNYRDQKAAAGFFKKVWLGMSKGYQLNKQKKAISEDIFSGDVDQTETLKSIIGLVKKGPDVRQLADGRFETNFASTKDFEGQLSEAEAASLETFNEVAKEFNTMPYEFKTGTPEQQDQYELAEKRYHDARDTVMRLKEQHGATTEEAMLYSNQLDQNLIMDQYMNAHPDVEEQLMAIRNNSALTQTVRGMLHVRDAASSNVGLFVGGFLGRSATIGLLKTSALVAAPIAGGIIGGWRGRRDAKTELSENELLARAGVEWNSPEHRKLIQERKQTEARNVISSDKLIAKFDTLLSQIEETEDPVTKETLLTRLNARINYTEEKMRGDLVNFGTAEQQAGNMLTVLQTLGRAKAYSNLPSSEELNHRVERFLGYRNDAIDERQRTFVNKRMWKGAAKGAGFGFAGAALAEVLGGNTAHAGELNSQATETATNPYAIDPEVAKEMARTEEELGIGGASESVAEPMSYTDTALLNTFKSLNPEQQATLLERLTNNAHGPTLTADLTPEQGRVLATFQSLPEAEQSAVVERLHNLGDPTVDINSQHGQMLHDQTADFMETGFPEDEEPIAQPDLGEPTVDINSEHGQMLDAQTADLVHEPMVDPRVADLKAEILNTPDYTVQPGDNIWKIIEKKLEAHDLFNGLDEGRRLHLIDELKDKVTAMSPEELKEFGIGSGNPDLIKVGEELDFSKIMGGDQVEAAVTHAENLSAAQIDSIEANQAAREAAAVVEKAGGEAASHINAPDWATISPDSQQAEMLTKQTADWVHDIVAEQNAPFVAAEVLEHDIHQLYGSDGILGIGGTKGIESIAWLDLKDRTVEELLSKREFPTFEPGSTTIAVDPQGFDSEQVVRKAQGYVQGLIKFSGVPPVPKETVVHYIERALTDAAAAQKIDLAA